MSVETRLASSWSAFERVGMTRPAAWHDPLDDPAGAGIAQQVILDAPGAVLLDGIMTTDWSMLYRVSVWPAAAPGDRVTAGTDTFEIREVLPVADGQVARMALRRLR